MRRAQKTLIAFNGDMPDKEELPAPLRDIINDAKDLSLPEKVSLAYSFTEGYLKTKPDPNSQTEVDTTFRSLMTGATADPSDQKMFAKCLLGYMGIDFDLALMLDPETEFELHDNPISQASLPHGFMAFDIGEGKSIVLEVNTGPPEVLEDEYAALPRRANFSLGEGLVAVIANFLSMLDERNELPNFKFSDNQDQRDTPPPAINEMRLSL